MSPRKPMTMIVKPEAMKKYSNWRKERSASVDWYLTKG
jgi:hypothetical protein